MKKTILALATAAVFATSANAATVFEQDGSKVEVNGAFGVLFTKVKDQRTDLLNDDSHFAFKVSHKINDNLTALGYSKIGFDGDSDSSFGNPQLSKLYAGLDIKGVGKLTFGKQATNGDDVYLNNNSYLLGNTEPQFVYFYDDIYLAKDLAKSLANDPLHAPLADAFLDNLDDEANLLVAADKSIKFRSADMHGFSFGLDYVFGESNKKAAGLNLKYAHQASVFYDRKLDNGLGFKLAAGYEVQRASTDVTSKTNSKQMGWRTSAQVAYGSVSFGAEYGQSLLKLNDVKLSKSTFMAVSANLQATEQSKIYTQWRRVEDKALFERLLGVDQNTQYSQTILPNEKVTADTFVLGADYQFHKNVLAYVEYNRVVVKGSRKVLHELDNQSAVTSHTAKAKGDVFGVGLRVLF